MHGWLHVIQLQHPTGKKSPSAHARLERAAADRGRQHGALFHDDCTDCKLPMRERQRERDRERESERERENSVGYHSVKPPSFSPALWIPTRFQEDRVIFWGFCCFFLKPPLSPCFFFFFFFFLPAQWMVFLRQQTQLVEQVWETAATAPLLPVSKGKCRARSRFQHHRALLLRSRTQTETPTRRRAPPRSSRRRRSSSSRSPRALAPAPPGKGWCLQPALWSSRPGWSTPPSRSGISRWNSPCWWAWSRSGRLATGTSWRRCWTWWVGG